MKNFFININDHKISYYDNCSDGQSIIFIHGNSHNGKNFWKQFSEPLLSKFRLIAIDLPGHGNSSPDFTDEAYSLSCYANTLQSFVEELGLNNSLFVGHSLGGHILLEGISKLNAKGLLIYGTPPIGIPLNPSVFLPHPDFKLFFKGELTDREAMSFASACFTYDSPTIRESIESIKKHILKQELNLQRVWENQNTRMK
ncbi:MAG: alpha/beta hydrolase [Bacteriovorax sp.]|nr:alpha/beta hydrolase [Bacteriovorax sp.]